MTRSRKKGFKLPPNTIVVDRSTRWGNPFRVGYVYVLTMVPSHLHSYQAAVSGYEEFEPGSPDMPDGAVWVRDQAEAVLLYRKYLRELEPRPIFSELAGYNLACWCKQSDPCHADLLLRLAAGEDIHTIPVCAPRYGKKYILHGECIRAAASGKHAVILAAPSDQALDDLVRQAQALGHEAQANADPQQFTIHFPSGGTIAIRESLDSSPELSTGSLT